MTSTLQTDLSNPTPARDPGLCSEREITEPVLECMPDGHLNPQAIGWSRQPLHRCNLSGAALRKKRWDYWCVTSEAFLLSITYTDLGFIGLCSVWFLEYASKRMAEKTSVVPFARGFIQPETVAGADIHFSGHDMRLDILESPEGTRLRVEARTQTGPLLAAVFVEQPPAHESLSVLVPWSMDRFQFTSKHNTRPADGFVEVGGTRYTFGPENQSFGCLDFGRGIWPYSTAWNWASASGRQGRHVVGLNLGGKWTDATGATENGLCIDGRLHKLSEDLVWTYDRKNWMAPWRIRTPRSQRVDLAFTPFFEKANVLNLGLIATNLHVCFGHFAGTVVSDEGERIEVSQLLGWAEEHLARW